MKIKKIVALTSKAVGTAVAFAINPAFGIFVGVWFFLGFDSFARENR